MSSQERHPTSNPAQRSAARTAGILLACALGVCALALTAGSAAATGGPPPTGPRSVIEDRAYKPGGITVAAGQTVTWHNETIAPHTVTSTTGLFGSGRLNGGETYTITFANPGTFNYYCTIHPTMKGAVTVLAMPPEKVLLSIVGRRTAHGRAETFKVQVARAGVKALLQLAPAHGAGGWSTAARAMLSSDGTVTLRAAPASAARRGRVVVPAAYGQPRLVSQTVRLPG
jgi:plastocyanin